MFHHKRSAHVTLSDKRAGETISAAGGAGAGPQASAVSLLRAGAQMLLLSDEESLHRLLCPPLLLHFTKDQMKRSP